MFTPPQKLQILAHIPSEREDKSQESADAPAGYHSSRKMCWLCQNGGNPKLVVSIWLPHPHNPEIGNVGKFIPVQTVKWEVSLGCCTALCFRWPRPKGSFWIPNLQDGHPRQNSLARSRVNPRFLWNGPRVRRCSLV